jgi:hypothetical protein
MKGELSIREKSAREDAVEQSKQSTLDRLARRNGVQAADENSVN